LDDTQFFRANRQTIIHRFACKSYRRMENGKIGLDLEPNRKFPSSSAKNVQVISGNGSPGNLFHQFRIYFRTDLIYFSRQSLAQQRFSILKVDLHN
jgi:hypothetical protein